MGILQVIEEPSGVEEPVTSVAYNYDQSSVAFGTSDGSVKVLISQRCVDLKVPAPVTAVAWAHPEHGNIVAIGTSAGHIHIWSQQPGQDADGNPIGTIKAQFHNNNKAIRCMSFAPKQHGLLLSAAGEDGTVRMYEADRPLDPQSWLLQSSFKASKGACSCLCWQPYTTGLPPLMAVGGAEGAHVWMWNPPEMRWQRLMAIGGDEVVKALHWAPRLGGDHERLAVAVGSRVGVYRLRADQAPEREAEIEAESEVWLLEWNMMGTSLACSTVGSEVQLWQQSLSGDWVKTQTIKGSSNLEDVDM